LRAKRHLDNGEFARVVFLFLVPGVEATSGEKCDLEDKFIPFLVVEGTIAFLAKSLNFPMMRNK
jgi:hypothetical protein